MAISFQFLPNIANEYELFETSTINFTELIHSETNAMARNARMNE